MSTVVYVKPHCPYSAAARAHLTIKGETFEVRDATAKPEWKAELMRYSRGSGVVPTIVRSGEREDVQVGFPPGRG